MKKGFFNFEGEEGYDFLESIVANNKTICAFDFLHGKCEKFALALNEIFGYKIILWTNYDYDLKTNVLIHAFNVFEHNGKTYYADIRGVTDDLNEITNGYDYSQELIEPCCYDNEGAKQILIKLGISTQKDDDAFKIINYYESYYKLD